MISAKYHAGTDILIAGTQDCSCSMSDPSQNVLVHDRHPSYISRVLVEGDGSFVVIDNSSAWPRFYLASQVRLTALILCSVLYCIFQFHYFSFLAGAKKSLLFYTCEPVDCGHLWFVADQL
jgi:hypothetical protein